MTVLTQPHSQDIAVRCEDPGQACQILLGGGFAVEEAHYHMNQSRDWWTGGTKEDWMFCFFMDREGRELAHYFRNLGLLVINNAPRSHGNHLVIRKAYPPNCELPPA